MHLRSYAICLWPGLPRLWIRGDPQGILPALTATIAFNTLIILRFVYPEWLSPTIRSAGWLMVAVWLIVVVRAAKELPLLIAPRRAAKQVDHFVEAQLSFLKANWLEAEKLLRKNLQVESRDPPALLMLATVYRKTKRFEAAAETLDLLDSLECGDNWRLESYGERQRLVRAKHEPDDSPPVNTVSSASPIP